MFRFASPDYLYLLLVPVVLAVVFVMANIRVRSRMRRLGERRILAGLVDGSSKSRPVVKFVLLETALVLLTLALARPQMGLREEKSAKSGIEAVFCLDVSNSMLATDVQPNRMTRAKITVTNLIDRMREDKIALNVFAGEAYPQLPITSDYVSSRLFLDAISTNVVTLQGTNIAAAIELATHSFTENTKVGKAIVIITDGEDHEAGAKEAAEAAAKAGMRVFVLGVGTPEGAHIPTEEGLLTDETGQPVTSRLNEEMCREVAEAGKGTYARIDNSDRAFRQLQSEFEKMQKSSSVTAYSSYNEQFRAFALLAFVLLLAELFIFETRNSWLGRFRIFRQPNS
ncbi:MAG: VWA domain-containing protein [Alloprevotella sp.]